MKLIDLVGKRFGRLIVLSYYDKHKTKHRWLCKCDCGSELAIIGNSLKTGNTKSCGCYQVERAKFVNFVNLVGIKYGKLTVLALYGKSYNSNYWKCRCDCGETVIKNGANLVTGNTQSCGCLFLERVTKHGLSNNLKEYRKHIWTLDPSKKVRHAVSRSIRKAIKKIKGFKNGAVFDYLPYTANDLKKHLESLFDDWMNWDNYGGLMNDERRTWHIDHIIPQCKFKYKSLDDPIFLQCWSLSNLKPLEKIANRIKGDK